jgi:PKD repeat protein
MRVSLLVKYLVQGGIPFGGGLPEIVYRLPGASLAGQDTKGMNARVSILVAIIIALLLLPSIACAGDWTGGVPVTTVKSGTVTGDLWFDATPPDWAGQGVSDIIKTFTLPAAAMAEPGRIKWARLYVASYVGNMQNDYVFYNLNRWDGDGTPGYEWEMNETGHAPFVFVGQDGCNDNSALGGTTCDPYKVINNHETRVTSDYFMWYDMKDLIRNQTIFLNVKTAGSFDGRTKVATLVVAYDDPASSTLTQYWVNEGHDALAYYTEDNLGYIDDGSTEFGTRGAQPFTSATLTINHMSSHPGIFGFPSAANVQCIKSAACPSTPTITFTEALSDADRLQTVQSAYSGVIAWNVTSLIPITADGSSVRRNVTFGYARDTTQTGLSAFFKLPLAFLVLKSPVMPVANFTANQSSGTVPLAVQFNDTSSGSPTTWVWDFDGDGTADSTEQNGTFTYTTAGTYNVNLTVTSSSGSNTTIKTGFVNATPVPELISRFTNVTPRSGVAPLTVHFIDTSTGSPTAWNWTFGDTGAGNTSVLRNPSHTYGTPGSYSVNLTVTGQDGTNTTLKTGFVTVLSASGAPVAAFGAKPASGTAPLTVEFTDESVGSATSWAWDINNDGITDNTTQNASFTYTTTGTYTVKLTVTSPSGTDDEVKNGYVTVYSQPVVSVIPSLQSIGKGETQEYQIVMDRAPTGLSGYYTIVRLDTPAVAEITDITYPPWAQMSQNPPVPNQSALIGGTDTGHLITPGATGITLANITIRGNETGMTSLSLSTIHMDDDNEGGRIIPQTSGGTVIVGSYAGPVAEFMANTTSGPANLTVQFTDQSLGSPTVWAWDFDNDGDTDSTIQNPSCMYTDPGTFTVNLTVTNSAGSHSLVKPAYITVTTASGTPPAAAFSGTPRTGTVPLTVAFIDQSTGSPTSWAWDFNNDGTTDSTVKNPGYTYSSAGTNTVKLTAANRAGSNTSIQTGYVTATSANGPVASFTADPTEGKAPLAVTFTDTSTGYPESWYWNFGNDQTSVLKTTTITYSSAGIYPVTLNVSNEDGSSAATRYITVNTATGVPGVAFSASPTTGAVPLSVTFTDQSSDSPTSWEWDFDDDGTVDSTTQNPSHTYSTAGTYTVTLTATNTAGSDSLTRSSLITATSSSTASDLSIKTIVPNLGSVSGGSLFALVKNAVKVNITNSGTETSPASSVKLQSNDGFSATASVPAIAAGSFTMVSITDTTVRQTAGSSITYTATVDPDDMILETNENNNVKTGSFTVKYNGYMGKRYWPGGSDVTTRQTYDLHGGIAYSRGDSVYRSGSFGDGGWLSYTVNWKNTEPPIPSNATIKAAYLYVPYTWDNEHIAPDQTFIDFNGQRVTRASWNYDKSNFGVYADYEYGLLKYDVKSLYNKNEANSAVFTRANKDYSDPAQAAVYTKISMYEFFLVVVYEDSDSTRKQIFINDNFDLLGASPEYGTTSAQSIAYVPFTGMTIDTDDMESATLTTFVPSGDSHEGNILYNGNVLVSNVWDYGGSGTGVDGVPQVAVDTRDVTSSIQTSGNTFAIQSTDKGGTPCMAAIQQILVIDLGDSATPATTTTTTTKTTTTTTETITTYKSGSTVTLSSGQGSTSGGGTTGSGSSGGNSGSADRGSSGQQASRYQAGPVEGSDQLDGVTSANAAGALPDGLPLNWILGGLFMVGATSVVAYQKGWIPSGPISAFPEEKSGTCIWEGTSGSKSCQTFTVEHGIIRYRTPFLLNLTRTHLLVIGLVIVAIMLAGTAWSSGFLPVLPSGAYGSVSSGNGQEREFDLIPTIEDISDLDTTNHVPDYPAGFSARNGILFVYHGTDKYAVSNLELELSKGTGAVTITSQTVPPPVNVVNDQLTSYVEEMGNGDGILEPGEWLMVYADNCYDSSRADGEPKGRVLVWQPQDTGSRVEVPLKDSIRYSLKDAADGTVLQQGTLMMVPTTS